MKSFSPAEFSYSGDGMVGRCVENYLVTRELGHGGMGTVYEAVHVETERKAALKVLHRRYANHADAVPRFLNEAFIASHIQHAGLASVFSVGMLPDGTRYFLMDHMDGQTLGYRLRLSPKYSLPAALRLVEQLASTLSIVHAQGIVHCDLKPDNIMLISDPYSVGGERPVLLDFGIAREQSADVTNSTSTPAQRDEHVLGTPLYMSPEQCRGDKQIDGKADVYALGVLLFRLCTGRLPFMGELLVLLVNHVAAEPPSPRSMNPAISAPLEALILSMLAKSPQARPSMSEVSAKLRSIMAHAQPSDLAHAQPSVLAHAQPRVPANKVRSLAPLARPSTHAARPWPFITALVAWVAMAMWSPLIW